MGAPKKQLDLSIFQQIAEQSSELWFIYDLTTQSFTYLGPTFEAIWKRSPQGLLDNPATIIDTIHPDDGQYVLNNYKHFLKKKESLRLDFRIIYPDGNQRWIALKTYPIEQDGEVTLVAGLAEDDTPRKENLLFLQTTNGKKNASLEIISHDLRGPLAMIQSLVNMLKEDTSSLSGAQPQKYLGLIRELCERNLNLIKNLTNEEYLTSPQVEIDMERLDMVAETKAVMEQYKQAEGDISKVFKLTSSKPSIYAEVDSAKFLAIINNLVSNAIKFTPDKGHIDVHLEEKEKEEVVLITVKDNGIGIPAKYHLTLFDKFTKARRPGLKGEETVGLGMSIVKHLVDMHGGKIYFESEENKGTTFYVEIPKKPISTSKL
jgi:two-component system sensor histidine kinase VicK